MQHYANTVVHNSFFWDSGFSEFYLFDFMPCQMFSCKHNLLTRRYVNVFGVLRLSPPPPPQKHKPHMDHSSQEPVP